MRRAVACLAARAVHLRVAAAEIGGQTGGPGRAGGAVCADGPRSPARGHGVTGDADSDGRAGAAAAHAHLGRRARGNALLLTVAAKAGGALAPVAARGRACAL